MEKPAKKPLLIAAALAIVAAGVLVLILGRGGTPSDASAEAGFARDMGTHHAQAVQMSFLVYDRSTSPDVRNLAFDIINTQSTQRGMFLGWLEQWGLGQAGERRQMAWMAGHGGHGGGTGATSSVMPGMASADELTKLKGLKGTAAEVLFLQLMIRHHEGGVQMAQALIKLSDRDEVVRSANKIVVGQSGEIKLMANLLKHRGAQPLASILAP